MEQNENIVLCSACQCPMDIAPLQPFTNVQCPNCGTQTRVKCELDQYIIQRRQGEGGMSLVFAARDNELGREVAIKILNESYSADQTRIEQFEQEARITAGISHPNVVRLYTVGQAFHRYYIAMELVSGSSMEGMMNKQGALPEEQIIPIMFQVTEGLNAAYQVGLIHRDIKPGNILIDSLGKPKIVDFGLALVTQGGSAIAEEIWATPYYVPPEALDGKAEDFRSDVYALCATMFHALAGQPPFTVQTKSTSELSEIKRSLPQLKSIAPWLSDSICAVIDKGISFEAEDRFSSYEEMLEAVQYAGDNIGVEGATLPRKGKKRADGFTGDFQESLKWLIPTLCGIGALGVGGFFVVNSAINNTRLIKSTDQAPIEAVKPVTTIKINHELRAKIHNGYKEAEKLVKEKKFSHASTRFLETMEITEHPEPSATLAGFHAITCASLAGNPREARRCTRILEKHIQQAFYAKGEIEPLSATNELKNFKNFGAYTPSATSFYQLPQAKSLLLFSSAIKNGEAGLWQESIAQFKEFDKVDVESFGKHKQLITYYKAHTLNYLADIEALKKLQTVNLKSITSTEDVNNQKNEIKQLQFQSNLKRANWLKEIYLKKLEQRLNKLQSQAQKNRENELLEQARKRNFSEVLAPHYPTFIARRYREMVTIFKAVEFAAEEDQKKQQAFIWLCQNAEQYFQDYVTHLENKTITHSYQNSKGKFSEIEATIKAAGLIIKKKHPHLKMI